MESSNLFNEYTVKLQHLNSEHNNKQQQTDGQKARTRFIIRQREKEESFFWMSWLPTAFRERKEMEEATALEY